MGGCRCSFRNCQNTTKIGNEYHFFNFPVKQWERCVEWIKRAQKPQFFDLHITQLKNKKICEQHFAPEMFTNAEKKRLLKSAVPRAEPEEMINPTDVKVVPCNDDGTIFTLDDEFLNTSNNYTCIPTYNIDNDKLVLKETNAIDISSDTEEVPTQSCQLNERNYVIVTPSQQRTVQPTKKRKVVKTVVVSKKINLDPKPFIEKPSSPQILYANEQSNGPTIEIINAPIDLIDVKCENPANSSSLINITQVPQAVETFEITQPQQQQPKFEPISQETPNGEEDIKQAITKPQKAFRKKKSLQQIIKEHSSAIARLEKATFNNKTIKKLKKAPPSLITLLNILTKTTNKYTEKELELINTFSSYPELCEKLNKQFGWNIPTN